MPTYEYKCLDCGERSEVFQSMKDEPLKSCQACNGQLKRLIGAGAGVIFKGSGFYGTDYRSPSYSQGASKETTASKADAGGTEKDTTPKSTAGKKDGGTP